MVGGGGLQAGIAFGSNVVLARYLMPEDFGTFAIIQANISLSSIIINLKLGQLLISATPHEVEKQYRLITTAAYFQSTVNTLIGLILLSTWNLLTTEAIILLFDNLISPLILLQITLYERKGNYRKISLMETSSKALSHLVAVTLVFFGLGSLALYIRVVVETLVKVLYLIRYKEFKVLPCDAKLLYSIKGLIKNVRNFWVNGFAEALFERILILFAGYALNTQQLGYFAQAKRLATTPQQLFQPIAYRVSFYFFSRSNHTDGKSRLLKKILLTEFMVLLPIAIMIVLFGQEVVIYLFEEVGGISYYTATYVGCGSFSYYVQYVQKLLYV